MKKLIVLGVLLVAVICTFCLVNHKEEDYLRIHIRANSNSEYDQQIKYQVKDTVVSALKPIVDSIQSKDDMINILNQNVEHLFNSDSTKTLPPWCFSMVTFTR